MRCTAVLATLVVALGWIGCSEFPTRPAEAVGDRDVGDATGPGEDAGGDTGERADCTQSDECDDGLFCNGAENCDPGHPAADARGCVSGPAPTVDDGIECTRDGCDEAADRVLHDPSGCACLAEGTACDCDADPERCPDTVPVCHVVLCTADLTCAARPAAVGLACSDGVNCTADDACDGDGQCVGTPSDSLCADPLFCNGAEVCAPTAPGVDDNGCLPGTPPPLDDGLDCTTDVCNEDRDEVEHVGINCQTCQEDADCVAEREVACRRLVCSEGVCATEPLEVGSRCDDTFACTGPDQCEANGVCRGAPTDALCNDGLWCNGIEICQPQDLQPDPAGCVNGPPPSVPDGVECTNDVCRECSGDCQRGLEGTVTYEPTDACECRDSNDCAAGTCAVGVCDPATFTCGVTLADPGTSCTAEDACIEGATCNENGECVGGVDACDCRDDNDCPAAGPCATAMCLEGRCAEVNLDAGVVCTVDDTCLENTRCDGNGECAGDYVCDCEVDADCDTGPCVANGQCVEGRCTVDFLALGTPCGDAVGCVEPQCDGEGACEGVAVEALCARPCVQTQCMPLSELADDSGCVIGPQEPNGALCDSECQPGADDGECWDGACFAEPEGPTGNDTCNDGVDNDCDVATDEQDSDCGDVATVALTGPAQLPVGLGLPTSPLSMVPLTRAEQGVTRQQDNAYCVARHLLYEAVFETGAIEGDTYLALSDGAVDGVDVTDGYRQGLSEMGVRMCNGHGIEIGPLPFPDPATGLTYMVELEVGAELDSPLTREEHLVFAYRTDELDTGDYFPLVAVNETGREVGPRRYQFVFDNVAGMENLSLRLRTLVQGEGRCAYVTNFRLYSMPRIDRDGVGPQFRDYATWQYSGTTEAAYQGFEDGFDAGEFLDHRSGDVSAGIDAGGAMLGATGLEWDYRNAQFGLIGLPEVVQHPVTRDRSDPLIFDFAAWDSGANYRGDRELWHMATYVQNQLSVLASVVPRDVQWIEHHDALGAPEIEHHRYLVPLPEDMKVLGSRRLAMYAQFMGIGDTDAFADELHLYWFTRPRREDITVRVLRPLERNGATLPVLVHSARAGLVLVRCYWQVPDNPNYRTVESAPHYLIFR